MFPCDQCDKTFDTYRGLNGHKRLHGASGGLLLAKRNPREQYQCLSCGLTRTKNKNSLGKYCNNRCQQDHAWETRGRAQVEEGRGQAEQIKRYLLERDPYECSVCGIEDWQGNPITLQVDHIDGNSDNNLPANLRFVCPNCHWQMDTTLDRTRKSTQRNDYLRKYKRERRQRREQGEAVNQNVAIDRDAC